MTVTAEREQELLKSIPTGLLINGEWRDASSGKTLDVEDPATGKVLLSIQDANTDDAMAALDAAAAAQKDWALTAPRERAEILRRAFDLVIERADDFALLMTLEMGKPLAEARGEVTYGAEFLRWFSEETVRHYGRYLTTPEGKNKILVQHKPVGPALLITPWNFPLAMATRKVAPAVAAGCTMVLKPAKLTPLTSLLFAQVMQEAGLPAGVLNVVAGSSASAISGPLMKDRRLRKVSFTGSTPVGRRLMADAAENVLRTSMELGGNAPFLVFEDADLDAAVEGAMAAKMRNMGEACTAANRFLVHESVAEEFTAKFAEAMKAQKPARGTESDATVGPLIDGGARDDVHSLVTEAVESGAEVATGGDKMEGEGYFYQPTVLKVANDCPILGQEIFGPVAPVTTFSTEEEAIELANASEYGLASYLYTRDVNRMFRVSEQIEFGMVGFNAGVISNAAAPFGGVKQSGLGREGGAEGIEEYTTVQYIGIADPYAAKK
ncbi:NAD-dependent succinate-semialdehyde dehydrogenase [Micrococcus terreus]|uniref:NAD-dependent succinate-semialdehyde dehydrogenase n=1 Tax=Micrococcus terreus TaxID=574650 RepID=UPI00254A2B66|nr:NAD-dependent succinate-semialdehyde dehydrogenase [Micrococcus terreus]MDK7701960.1 NAD-dependent succinate-semialdehyde dehydrogenase [Micrococcus terreus]WOO97699.1 NAD-dependent succinate-semialdehyde dehydrogenase [Micrococcus terreus]